MMFVEVLVPARTKLTELEGNCRGKNGKRCESSKEHQNISFKFLGYLRQRPFIKVGIDISCVKRGILRKMGQMLHTG